MRDRLIVIQSVTITLRQGNPDSLDTVGILADGVEGYSYNWTVSRTLAPAKYVSLVPNGRVLTERQ